MNPFIRLLMERGRQNPRHNTGQSQSALLRILGGWINNRMQTQQNFNTQMRTGDPAYQRGMNSQWQQQYNQYNAAPQPPKTPRYPM